MWWFLIGILVGILLGNNGTRSNLIAATQKVVNKIDAFIKKHTK